MDTVASANNMRAAASETMKLSARNAAFHEFDQFLFGCATGVRVVPGLPTPEASGLIWVVRHRAKEILKSRWTFDPGAGVLFAADYDDDRRHAPAVKRRMPIHERPSGGAIQYPCLDTGGICQLHDVRNGVDRVGTPVFRHNEQTKAAARVSQPRGQIPWCVRP